MSQRGWLGGEEWHPLADDGPGFDHIESNARYNRYSSLLLTF